jgi:lipoprotein-releasing system permease protein
MVCCIECLRVDLNRTIKLNLPFYIAKRIAFNRQKSFSRFIIRLSVAATALSVAAMIITLSFVNGFQKTISQKVFSFWGHIRVQEYRQDKSLIAEELAISKNDTVENILLHQNNIAHFQVFATKSAVAEKNKEIEGILFKGIDEKFDSTRFKNFIRSGQWLHWNDSMYSREILLSASTANALKASVKDTVIIYFISSSNTNSTYRKLKVAGIYKTGIEEYDKLFALGDIRLIRRLNNWDNDKIGGYEIFLNDYTTLDATNNQLLNKLPVSWDSKTIKEVYPNIFDWLNIQDVNRNVIFIIMVIVAIINLITCLLILVLERTRMVGILKAIGTENWPIQKIFLYQASFITLAGVGLGLIGGLGLCWLQQLTGLVRLDESNYYVAVAPIEIIGWQVIVICAGTAIVCFISLLLPTLLIKNIQPVKAIQFR